MLSESGNTSPVSSSTRAASISPLARNISTAAPTVIKRLPFLRIASITKALMISASSRLRADCPASARRLRVGFKATAASLRCKVG